MSTKQFVSRVFGLVALVGLGVSLSQVAAAEPRRRAPSLSTTSGRVRTGQTHRRDFGFGLMLGEPSGLTAKSWLTGTTALQAGLTYSWHHYVGVSVDHLWHLEGLLGRNVMSDQLVPYAGLGAAVEFSTGNSSEEQQFYNGRWWKVESEQRGPVLVGARVPLGIEFRPRTTPLSVYVELAPGLQLVPGIYGFVQAVIGARFYI